MKKLFSFLCLLMLGAGMSAWAGSWSWNWNELYPDGSDYIGYISGNSDYVFYAYEFERNASSDPSLVWAVCFEKSQAGSYKDYLWPKPGTYTIQKSQAVNRTARYDGQGSNWQFGSSKYSSSIYNASGTRYRFYSGDVYVEEGADGPYIRCTNLVLANAAFTSTYSGTNDFTVGSAATYYSITVNSNDNSLGTVATPVYKSGYVYANNRSQEYKKNSVYTLTANEAAGVFVEWQKNGSRISTNPVVDVTIDGNATYTAVFTAASGGTITVNAGSNGQVKLDNGLWGSTFNHTYSGGESATIAAQANEGYLFYRWTDNASATNTTNPYNFTVSSDNTYTAEFKRAYTITTGVNNSDYGSVGITDPYSGGKYYEGQSITLTATPANLLCSFVKWQKNGADIPGATSATYNTTVTGNDTYTAVFDGITATTIDVQAALNTNHGWGWGYCFYYWAKAYGYDIMIRAIDNWSWAAGDEMGISDINTSESYINDHGTTVRFTAFTGSCYEQGGKKVLEAIATGDNGKTYYLILRGVTADSDDTAEAYNQSFTSGQTSIRDGMDNVSDIKWFRAQNGTGESYSTTWCSHLFFKLDQTKCGTIPSGIYPINDTQQAGTVVSTAGSNNQSYGSYYVQSYLYYVPVTGWVEVVNRDEQYYVYADAYNSRGYDYKTTYGTAPYSVTVSSNSNTYGTANIVWHSANCGDVTYTAVDMPQKFFSGNTITLTATANSGYEFWRWSDEDESVETSAYGTSRNITVSSDLTLQAIFRGEVTKHTVSITAPTHGTITVTYTEGTEKTLTEGNRDIAENTSLTITAEGIDGYHCTGLTVGGNNFTSGNTHTLTADVTIAATFAVNTYTVAFDKNGGSGSMDSESYTYDTEKNIPANGFTAPTGKHFNGWNTLANGSGTAYAAGARGDQMTADHGSTVTLFAQWADNTFTIAFNGNGGSGSMGNESYTYGTEKNIPANGFTAPTGMHFTGWNTEENGTGDSYAAGDRGDQITTENGVTVTLYAQWTANTYALTLDKGDGSADGSATATYNSNTLTSVSHATKGGGWTLQGYYTAASDGDMVINADGELVANVSGYTDEDGKWIRTTGSMTLYAQWSQEEVNIDLYDNAAPKVNSVETTNEALLAAYGGRPVNVTLHHSFTANLWNTLCLPFDYELSDHEVLDGNVYDMSNCTTSPENGMVLTFAPVDRIDAGKPYLVWTESNSISSVQFENVTLSTFTPDTTLARSEDVEFRAVMETTYIKNKESIYIGSGNRLYYANPSANGGQGTRVRGYRAYFEIINLNGMEYAPARVRIMIEGKDSPVLTTEDVEEVPTRKYVKDGILIIERGGVRYDAQGKKID